MSNWKTAGCAVVCWLSLASASDASIFTATSTGVVTYGGDSSGLFGPSPVSAGTPFTATYTFDPTQGSLRPEYLPGEVHSGGIVEGAVPGLLTASLTINDVTFNFDTSYLSSLFYNPSGGHSVTYEVCELGFPSLTCLETGLNKYANFRHLNNTGSVDGIGYGMFFYNLGSGGTDLYLRSSHLTVTGDGPDVLPEPGAWALCVLGFVLVGAMLRRCRNQLAEAVATTWVGS